MSFCKLGQHIAYMDFELQKICRHGLRIHVLFFFGIGYEHYIWVLMVYIKANT